MRARLIAALGLSAAALPAAANAADWSSDLSLVSDYRYRGVSLSGEKPALQGTADVELKSGAYGELWVSTIKDDGAGKLELDGSAGYAFDLADGISLDVSATYYLYPGHVSSNAHEFTVVVEGTHGPFTASLGASVAPPQRGTRDDDDRRRTNLYLFGVAGYAVKNTPLTLRAQIGREQGPWDMRERGSKWDYALGLQAGFERAKVSLDLVGSNAGSDGLVASAALRF